ncbi:metallopeptidase family protein [Aeromicrobium sp. 50.2.37]|uniref:metallopeptidase family protein n=1 Tax=Aeromicrobium sp. 50.2.37 TaxID=2969305 RepID=UPI0021506722|nr:metallopeptidase family protein [Aeromicrobium sp. 50.2.37]MCR4512526.1 metallopeptidase family protein [Aeromicrobium sp. 50.2.37]
MAGRLQHLGGAVSGPRPGRMRARRRAARGPLALPGPLSPASVPAHRTPREEFDHLVAGVLAPLEKHFDAEPDEVEVVVEDVPLLPADWTDEVPLSNLSRRGDVALVVLYRRPLTDHCTSRIELEDRVWDVVLHRLAEVWQVSPDDLDPR